MWRANAQLGTKAARRSHVREGTDPIQTHITDNQREILRAHWSSLGHIATATELARAIGTSSYKAVNMQYGLLGERLREQMNYSALGRQQSYIIAWLEGPSPGREWRYQAHVHALARGESTTSAGPAIARADAARRNRSCQLETSSSGVQWVGAQASTGR